MDDKLKQHIDELLIIALEGKATNDQKDQLNNLIRSSRDICEYCSLFIELSSHLYMPDQLSMLFIEKDKLETREYIQSLHELCHLEETASVVHIEPETPAPVITEITTQENPQPNKFFQIYNRLITAAAVLLIVFIIYANLFPPKYTIEVATIVDQMNVKWNRTSNQLGINDRLATNQQPYSINDGIIKIAYDYGVDVIIEGPAKFEIEREGIFMDYGRIYTRVTQVGQGFTVDSKAVKYVDLGTEFGVQIGKSGTSEIHVLDGSVQLYAGFKGCLKETRTISENYAVRFNAESDSLEDIPVQQGMFVRNIHSESDIIWRGGDLELGDIVGGGNGFGTGLSGGGINLQTGQFDDRYIRKGRMYIAEKIFWSPVDSNPFIDSVFIADGSEGPQQVSTSGHLYGFNPTDRRFHHDIFYSVSAKTMLPADEMSETPDQSNDITLDGIGYGVEGHPAIFIHAPSGITFDLTAIRQNLAEFEISRLKSIIGIPDAERDGATLDIIVLIDGVCVFQKSNYTVDDPSIKLDIPIPPDCRFLTLAVTDGGDGAWWDLCVFGDPRFELTSR